MKITATQYAKSLYELTVGKSETEIDGVVAKFLKVLIKNRQLKIAKKIMESFATIFNAENGIVEAEVATSRELESSQVHKIKSFLKEKYQAKEVVMKNKIDASIKGGVVIRVEDEILDGSVARQLGELKRVLNS
jgi:F-type H+-transporting ATPase subunit delta